MEGESYEVPNVERKVPIRLVLDPSTSLKDCPFYFDSSVDTRKYGDIGRGSTYRQTKPGRNPRVVCTREEFSRKSLESVKIYMQLLDYNRSPLPEHETAVGNEITQSPLIVVLPETGCVYQFEKTQDFEILFLVTCTAYSKDIREEDRFFYLDLQLVEPSAGQVWIPYAPIKIFTRMKKRKNKAQEKSTIKLYASNFQIFLSSHFQQEQSETKPSPVTSFSPSFDVVTPSSVRIMKVHPLEGSCLGDTEVTIEGEGLGTCCSEVLVGGVPVDVGYYVKTNCLKFRTPAGYPGYVPLQLKIDNDYFPLGYFNYTTDLTDCEEVTDPSQVMVDNPIPLFSEDEISRLLAEEWVQRSQEFGERATCINQDLLLELDKIIDNGFSVDYGTSPSNARNALLQAKKIIRNHPKRIASVSDLVGIPKIGPFLREKIGLALVNMNERANGKKVEYDPEVRGDSMIENVNEFRTKLLSIPRIDNGVKVKLPPNLIRNRIKVKWLQSGIEYVSRIVGVSPNSSPTGSSCGLLAVVTGSENQKYCTSLTFISDKQTIRKTYCECPISKKVKNYWCKHVWAVVLAHCPDEELIKLCAIASAEYIEDSLDENSTDNVIKSPPTTPNSRTSNKVSLDNFESDSVAKTLKFSPPPKSPHQPLLRRSADYPLRESPHKIAKLTKSSNDVALVSPTKAGSLPIMSHEIIMYLFNKKIFDINVAVSKQETKDNLKLKTFDKISTILLTRGLITETNTNKIFLSQSGIAFGYQYLRENPTSVSTNFVDSKLSFPTMLDASIPIPDIVNWPPLSYNGEFRNFPSTKECSIEDYIQIWNSLINPSQYICPSIYYGFQFGYSQIKPSPEEPLQIVYPESPDKIRVLVPSTQVNQIIAYMSSKSNSTGDGLYKELSLLTVGITQAAVRKYFTLNSTPPKGTMISSMNQLRLLVDFREHFASLTKLRDMMMALGVVTEVRNLPEGDFGWAVEAGGSIYQIEYLVERKKLMDLLSTLDDIRAYDQPDRLALKGVNWDIIYLIEGDKENNMHFQERVDQQRVDNFFGSLREKNFKIEHTLNEEHTFEWIVDKTLKIFERFKNVYEID